MRSQASKLKRILAIEPVWSGFAFFILETPDRIVDRGTCRARAHHAARNVALPLRCLSRLITLYRPTLVVAPDLSKSTRRGEASRDLIRDAERICVINGVRFREIPTSAIRSVFDLPAKGEVSRHAVASGVVACLPELAGYLPPRRKLWKSENPRHSILMAGALALCAAPETFQHLREDRIGADRPDGNPLSP